MTIFALAIFTAGCSTTSTTDDALTGSCLISAPQPSCIEYANASSDELELDAEPNCISGTWRFEACIRASVIGGCTSHVTGPHGGFELTTWYYAGGAVTTTADVMARCNSSGQTFVAP